MIPYSKHPLTRSHAGRRSARPILTSYQIKQEADKFLHNGFSPHAERLLQILAVGGIMSVSQLIRLGVKLRTIQKYDANYLLDRLPRSSTDLIPEFEKWGLPYDMENKQETLLYLLGSVGLEIARQRGFTPEGGFLAYPVPRYMRQVVINEIRLRLSEFVIQRGYDVNWLDRGQTQVITEDERVLLPPTAMVGFQKESQFYPFFIEFHEKMDVAQSVQIISVYEKARASNAWHGQWAGETFPPLLLVISEKENAQIFQNTLKRDEFPRCLYYCKLLKAVLAPDASLAEWTNMSTGAREVIVP